MLFKGAKTTEIKHEWKNIGCTFLSVAQTQALLLVQDYCWTLYVPGSTYVQMHSLITPSPNFMQNICENYNKWKHRSWPHPIYFDFDVVFVYWLNTAKLIFQMSQVSNDVQVEHEKSRKCKQQVDGRRKKWIWKCLT